MVALNSLAGSALSFGFPVLVSFGKEEKGLIEDGVNHTLSIDQCAWASCICWW